MATAVVSTPLTTLTQIHNLEERYPFNEEELEILVRCHDHCKDGFGQQEDDDFLVQLAVSSPYSFFFLPGDEMRHRVHWIEDHVLPAGFANELRAAIAADAFVEYANQGESKSLERFLEGVADTGRRGTKEALKVLYNCVGDREGANPEKIMELCVSLVVATEALVAPCLDKEGTRSRLQVLRPAIESLSRALKEDCKTEEEVTLKEFVAWAEEVLPVLSAPLSTFVHHLLFHGHPYPEPRIPHVFPSLDHASDIFSTKSSAFLVCLSLASPILAGKWNRLYSAEIDGWSFNRFEWSLTGYSGPTLLVVATTRGATLGAFTGSPWKEGSGFHGHGDGFLFQLAPNLRVHHPLGGEGHNFMFLHSDFHGGSPTVLPPEGQAVQYGLGLGGNLQQPRLFIPESFETCTANFLDKTYRPGELLPEENMERFELLHLEVWGVGGDEACRRALRDRSEYRERTETALYRARVVHDKSTFAKDLKSGLLMPAKDGDGHSKLFGHTEQVRGRSEFRVDDRHGGYKLERE